MSSPFSEINELLTDILWKKRPTVQTIDSVVFCNQQVSLLDTVYRSMMEFDMSIMKNLKKKSAGELEVTGDPRKLNFSKAFLDYFSLINILNQMVRVFSNKFQQNPTLIPDSEKIRFFRNKVLEHWDDYTNHLVYGSISQTFGKPAIPIVNQEFSSTERSKIKQEITKIFAKLGIKFYLDNDPKIINLSIDNKYSETFYTSLKQIDPTLCAKDPGNSYKIPEKLVELMFKYGFPMPITDVESYCTKLSRNLCEHFGL